ncbi:MAG: hypothetical protein HC905_25860 [Bacteroidales bacterium]|nr:hypothetical protein [Bacteroidales bacterium]
MGDGAQNKLTRSTVTKTYSGQSPYTRLTDFTYDNKGNPLLKITDPGKTKAVTETMTYLTNSCGLPVSKSISANDITIRKDSFCYEPKYRFIEKQLNAP